MDRTVLIVGASHRTTATLTALVHATSLRGDRFSVTTVSTLSARLPQDPEVILLAYARRSLDAGRLKLLDAGATRSRLVLDLRESSARELWDGYEHPLVPLLVVGSEEADEKARGELRGLLYTDALWALDFEGTTLTRAQRRLLTEILRRADRPNPAAIARDMYVSLRTLRRRCEGVGLETPQRLHQLGRVLLGVQWAIRTGGPLERAARIAGYSRPYSFRRAARDCLDCSPVSLLRNRTDHVSLAQRIAVAACRSGPP